MQLLLIFHVALAAAAAGAPTDGGTATCTAGEADCEGVEAGDDGPHYYWPLARGRPESPSRSPYKGPKSLKASLAWTWQHPEGQYAAIMPAAPLIDGEKNLYLATTVEVVKLSPNGMVLWTHHSPGRMSDNPGIWNGMLFTHTQQGVVLALDMASGRQVWQVKPADSVGGDIAAVTPYKGRLFLSLGASPHGGTMHVFALNATNGETLWSMTPETPMWNFLPLFPGDGTLAFNTENGDPYVLHQSNGSTVWRVSRGGRHWTDGGANIGPNGVVYVPHAEGHQDVLSPTQPSDLTAYRLSDGKQLWRHHYGTPPNSWPVVAEMGEKKRWEVLFPYGGQAYQSAIGLLWSYLPYSITPQVIYFLVYSLYMQMGSWGPWLLKKTIGGGLHTLWPGGVTAFEPETGKVLWEWEAPDFKRPEVKGDDAGFPFRMGFVMQGKIYGQTVCIPNPWASPTVDADSTLFTGFQDGVIYALQEQQGKGVVVDSYETTAGFSHPGIAMAPGMLAVANCDTLYVFKYEEAP